MEIKYAKIEELKISWLAGIVDGEGSIELKNGRTICKKCDLKSETYAGRTIKNRIYPYQSDKAE
jgi:hypothetical protein